MDTIVISGKVKTVTIEYRTVTDQTYKTVKDTVDTTKPITFKPQLSASNIRITPKEATTPEDTTFDMTVELKACFKHKGELH